MSDAIKKLHDYLAKSPSVVYPEDVLAYLPAIEDENAKLREFAHGLIDGYECGRGELCEGCAWDGMDDPRTFNCKVRVEARKLGVEE